MKKHILLFLSIFSLVTFSGCDDRDEIRDDINALSARLDALQVEFDKLNSNINTFYNHTNFFFRLFKSFTLSNKFSCFSISTMFT